MNPGPPVWQTGILTRLDYRRAMNYNPRRFKNLTGFKARMRVYLYPLFTGILILFYHLLLPDPSILRRVYLFLLSPFFERYGELLCRGENCIYLTKDCLGVYTFLMTSCFLLMIKKRFFLKGFLLSILFSFLFNYVRLLMIISSPFPDIIHSILTLSIPPISLGIAILIKKIGC